VKKGFIFKKGRWEFYEQRQDFDPAANQMVITVRRI